MVNAKRYQQILETHFFPYISRANRQFRFQQDDSPIHKARAITDLFERHSLDWLAYSPDINPIENLWAILKEKVEKEVNLRLMKKKKLSTIDFQTTIRQEWEGLVDNLLG